MVPATQYEQPWREEVTAPAGHSAMHCVEPGKETCPEGHCVQAPPTPPGLKKPARHGEHGNPGAEEDCPGPQATQLSPETLEKPTGHDSHDAWPYRHGCPGRHVAVLAGQTEHEAPEGRGVALYLFGSQIEHPAPMASGKDPGAHVLAQAGAPAEEKSPGAQASQLLDEMLPSAPRNVPAVHSEHDVDRGNAA